MSLFGKDESLKGKKSLVIYFSRAGENYAVGNIDKGNTEVIAEYIQEITDADLFKVETIKEYSENYKICCDEALAEKNQSARPELKKYLDNINEYEVIYIGYPNWWGTMPMPMFTQLEKLDFTGKIIKPFCTHEGSGLGSSESDIKRICKEAKIMSGLAIQGCTVHGAKNKVENWI
jgi:flavodoxin